MLTLNTSRRNFMRVGAAGALTLPWLLEQTAAAKNQGRDIKDKSVIWVWLGGGPTHVETFDPKMTAPAEFRAMNGEAQTPIPGVSIGADFSRLAKLGNRMAFLRSYAHGNNNHDNGTTLGMTGYNDAEKPALGSIISRAVGTTNAITGMSTYISTGRIGNDDAGWLGTRYSPFSASGPASQNMRKVQTSEHYAERRSLLGQLDRIPRNIDATGRLDGLSKFDGQAFELILGSAQEAFNVKKEPVKVQERYAGRLGASLLQARRLCEAGCKFVTASHGGWDMHSKLASTIKKRGAEVDIAVSALIEDLDQRGMLDDTLVVITGDFGRTPRINKNAGRDHWGNLCTMALAGGGLRMGQVIGESSSNVETPKSAPIGPQDVLATILEMFGIGHEFQVKNPQGRPMYLIEDGKPIAELI